MPKHGVTAITSQAGEPGPVAIRRPRSAKVRKAVALLLSGECKTQKAAAAVVGLNHTHLCRALATPQLRAFVASESRRSIHAAQIPAVGVLAALLDAASERVRAEVATRLLAINGIAAPERSGAAVSVDVRVGYVINLGEDVGQVVGRNDVDGNSQA